MFPEKMSLQLIELISGKVDPGKAGTAIEIGVGTDNFYSLVYKNLGYRTIAVDPVPYAPFVALATQHGIVYDESCIYQEDGETVIYTSATSDLSSLYHNWWGVDNTQSKTIRSQTLDTFINQHGIKEISFLKVDTEGSEYEILEQFKIHPQNLLPKVLEFEYGGGGFKKDLSGGWAPAFFNKSLKILDLLKALGYKEAILFDSVELAPIMFSFAQYANFEELFLPGFEYGNIIAFKEPLADIGEVKEQLRIAHDIFLKEYLSALKRENTNLYLELVRKDYTKRIFNKIKRTLKIK